MSPPPTSIDGTDITGATIDGQDVQEITVDGETVFVAFSGPDQDIYLQDDFGDNALQNRTGTETTTHNGVTGTFRPDYDPLLSGLPTVSSQTLNILGNEGAVTDINLNLSETITWEWQNVDRTNNSSQGGSQLLLHCFAEQRASIVDARLDKSYSVLMNDAATDLVKEDSGFTRLIDGSGVTTSANIMVTLS